MPAQPIMKVDCSHFFPLVMIFSSMHPEEGLYENSRLESSTVLPRIFHFLCAVWPSANYSTNIPFPYSHLLGGPSLYPTDVSPAVSCHREDAVG